MTREGMVYVVAAAAANVLGAAAITSRPRWSPRALETMLALAAGFMLSASLTDILPEAIESGGRTAAIVALIGYMLVHLTQHTLAPHFHFGEETHEVNASVSASALVGLMLHTLVDGVAIATGFRISTGLGVVIWIAILLHKVPEGVAISSLFLAAGASRAKALAAAASLGAATVVGALITDVVPALATHGLALSAGVTLYVGASNLVPEFQSKHGWRQPASFFAGCGLYFLARSVARVG